MKIIRCPHQSCAGQAALSPPTKLYPQGEPIVMGTFTGEGAPLLVKCWRCRTTFRLRSGDFHRMPDATLEQLADLGLIEGRG